MSKTRFGLIVISSLAVAAALFIIPSSKVYAAQFRTDYTVDYYLDEKDNNIATHVGFKIKITNLTPDLFIRKFSIMFPKSFQIGNIKASDDYKTIIPDVTEENGKHVVTVEFSNPMGGLNSQNNIYLDFLQYNLFKVSGNVWEVILPTVENKEGGVDYTVTVHLPPNSGKQISISKPKPDHITLNEIVWKNPANKTIYALFGKQQNYALSLRYHLQNPNISRVYTDITFPPDTFYQKVFVNSIRPAPSEVFMDEDGNYLGRYYLNPKEEKTIYFNGSVEVYASARDDMRGPMQTLLDSEKKYLLSPSVHWKLDSNQMPPGLTTPLDIYNYTTHALTYNYGRLDSKLTRLGASQALQYPDQAVCTEYSDVFIAIARENGIYTREMQGYGFSNDQDLRPLSTNSDILHSWPEYYDETDRVWKEVDPTWESTSGIDYFNSLDLNHIVFAIHGKKSDYPYPAGSYKTAETTKDINITPTTDVFAEKSSLSFNLLPLSIPQLDKNTYQLKITVENTGNTFVWDMPLTASADKVEIIPPERQVVSLAPGEKKELTYEYTTNGFFSNPKALIAISSKGTKLYEHEMDITPFYFLVLKYVLIGGALIGGLVVAVKLIKK